MAASSIIVEGQIQQLKYLKPLNHVPDRDVFVDVYSDLELGQTRREYLRTELIPVGGEIKFPTFPMMILLKDAIDQYIRKENIIANAFTWQTGELETIVQLCQVPN